MDLIVYCLITPKTKKNLQCHLFFPSVFSIPRQNQSVFNWISEGAFLPN